jgi:hypothetical protein
MNKIKQYKLSSGDEVVCEILEDTEEGLLTRRVVQIDTIFLDDDSRAYVMRPWMLYQDGLNQYVLIRHKSVVASSTPTKSLVHQYYTTLMQTMTMHHARETHGDITDQLISILIAQLEDTDEHLASISADDYMLDSDESPSTSTNVVYLDTTVH